MLVLTQMVRGSAYVPTVGASNLLEQDAIEQGRRRIFTGEAHAEVDQGV